MFYFYYFFLSIHMYNIINILNYILCAPPCVMRIVADLQFGGGIVEGEKRKGKQNVNNI